jgi:hypothetical protein
MNAASRIRRVLGALGLLLAAGLSLAAGALGASPAPHLSVHSVAVPSTFSGAANARCLQDLSEEIVRTCDYYQVTVTDDGALKSDGTAVTIEDTLPAGLQVRGIALFRLVPHGETEKRGKTLIASGCTLTPVTCKFRPETIEGTLRTGILRPDEAIEMQIYVTVDEGASGPQTNSVSVSGGGAPPVSTTSTDEVSAEEEAVPFGASLGAAVTGLDGTAETQAGGHPYEFATRFDLGSEIRSSPESQLVADSGEDLKDAVIELPPGFIGSATSAPTCTFAQLDSVGGCPPASRVGRILTEPESNGSANSWIYNMLPEHGVAAELGFTDVLNNTHAIVATVVPTAAGYVTRATVHEIPQIALSDVVSSLFGDPTERNGEGPAAAFFTNPSDCSGQPLTTRLYLDSWQTPARLDPGGAPDLSDPNWKTATSQTPAVTGCEALAERFRPTISARPSSSSADSPTGLDVDIKVPQDQSPEVLGAPPLRRAVVTLPPGMSVNASSANGLEACSLAQVGISASGEPDGEPPTCPEASKIGTVELETPALDSEVCRVATRNLAECPAEAEHEKVPLEGSIYVARQKENPFGSLLAIYIVIDDARTGVLVKLAGEVEADPTTGQLTTVVDDSPQFPFSELRTHFFSGNRAALKTPALCGTYKVTSELTPWSAPQSGPPASPSARLKVDQAAGGGEECPADAEDEPNDPAFSAGTLSPQAGAYSPFVVNGARADGDQPITQVNVTLPKGLTGKLAGIPYCPESGIALARSREHEGGGAEELAHPACPAASEVGVARVGAGAGPEPFYVTGHAYLTGPYKGAPLSVVIVSPAVAGPFDLGDVVVRAALEVDPLTTQINAVSDQIPTILDGIPLDIRSISLEMSRPQFTLNPTDCEKMAVTGEALGQFGSTAALSEPFQVGGCKNLAFKPKLQISLKGSTRHAGHPALKAVLTYPRQGAYANVASAQVNLPHSEFIDQANLNKACTRPVLLAGACPASTIYGKAKAWTPLLGAPLEGPVYLVGGFGYKLPALVAELGGQIRVLLVGKVDSGPNHGIRNSFEAVPDAPVERFVLEMKGGSRYSLLENSEDLCKRPQRAIAAFTAQNGATLRLTPRIANSCGKGGHRGRGGHAAGHRHKGPGEK